MVKLWQRELHIAFYQMPWSHDIMPKDSGTVVFCCWDKFFNAITTDSRSPPNLVHIRTCKISCHYLIHTLTWSILYLMVPSVKQSGTSLTFQLIQGFRKQWSWPFAIGCKHALNKISANFHDVWVNTPITIVDHQIYIF